MEELINFISKDGLFLTIAILILIATTIFDFFSYSDKNTNIKDKETIKKIKRTSMYVKITIIYILIKILIWLLIFSVNILFYHTIFLGRLFATHRKKQAFRGSAIAPFLRNSPATDGGGFSFTMF